MGSGGLRGLQIPWSGASGVRGGFDSHAFPPLSALALALALALLAAPARAQAPPDPARPNVPADTIAHPPDIEVVNSSTLEVDAKAAKRAHADSLKARGWSAQPRFVMARSLLIPGWGQAYNHAWYKAGAVAAGEGWLASLIIKDQQVLDDLASEIDQLTADSSFAEADVKVNEYNDRLDQRIAHTWLFAAVLTYALVDAYVDAHFRGFELEFKHDPALPDGPPSATPTGGRKGGSGVRLGLRWHF